MEKKGFTLLELMIVLAVVAILAGVVMASIKGMRDQADMAKAKSDLGKIQTAVESYYIHQLPHVYPDWDKYAQTITAFLSSPKVDPHVVVSTLYDPFMPGGSTEYFYGLSNNGQYYVLASAGPKNGGDNRIKIDDKGVVGKQWQNMICVTNGSGC